MIEPDNPQEVSRSLISTTTMSTSCKVLEILFNRELQGLSSSDLDNDVWTAYNMRENKPVKIGQITKHVQLLRILGFIGNSQLTPIGKKIASRCANGEYDPIVSYNFFRAFYKTTTFYRDAVLKIREGQSDLDSIIDHIAELHGLNQYAYQKLKSWITDLNFTYKEGTVIKFDPLYESQALEWNSLSEFHSFLNSLNLDQDSFKEQNLYSEIDLNFFNGIISKSTISKIIMKMSDDHLLTISRGKFGINFIMVEKVTPEENITLQEYLFS